MCSPREHDQLGLQHVAVALAPVAIATWRGRSCLIVPSAWWHRLQRHDVTEFTPSFCSLYDAASRGPVFCESDGAAVHRPPRQHSNESDMAVDGRDIALIAVACDEIFFGRVATVIRPAASYQQEGGP